MTEYGVIDTKDKVKIDKSVLKKSKEFALIFSILHTQDVTDFLNKFTQYHKLLKIRCESEYSMQDKRAESDTVRQLREDIRIINERLLPYTPEEHQKFALLLAAASYPLDSVKGVLEKKGCMSEHTDRLWEVLEDVNSSHLKSCILDIAEQKGKLIFHDAITKWGVVIEKMEYRPIIFDESVLKKLKQLASISSTLRTQDVTDFLNKLTQYSKLLTERCQLEYSMQDGKVSPCTVRQLKEDIKIINDKLLPYTPEENQDFALLLAAVRYPLNSVKGVLEKGGCMSEHTDMISKVLEDLDALKNSHIKSSILDITEQKGKLMSHDTVTK